MRIGGILGLQWDNVDLNTGKINIRTIIGLTLDGFVLKQPKTAISVRTIFISEELKRSLKQHKEEQLTTGIKNPGNFVLYNAKTKGFYTQKCVLMSFKQLAKSLNLPPINIHALRHTHATLCMEEGKKVTQMFFQIES